MTLWWKVPGAFSCSSRRSGMAELGELHQLDTGRDAEDHAEDDRPTDGDDRAAEAAEASGGEHPEEVDALALRREEPERARGPQT